MTVAAIRVPIEQAKEFGVIETDADGRTISAFREKPLDAVGLPDSPDEVYASMGNYVFTTKALIDAVTADAAEEESKHDIGGDLIPRLVSAGTAQVYDFAATGCRERTSASARTGATWGRSTPSTTRTWTSSRSNPCSTSTTGGGRSSRGRTRSHLRSSCSRRTTASGRRSTRWCARESSSRALPSGGRFSRPRSGFIRTARSTARSSCTASTSAGKRSSQRDRRQERADRRARTDRRRRRTDRERFTVSAGGIVVIGKGAVVEAD